MLRDEDTIQGVYPSPRNAQGRGTGTREDEEMALFACAATSACLAEGGLLAGRLPTGRGEVLGWARALSPRVGSRGLPWVIGFLLEVCVGSRLKMNIAHMFGWVKGMGERIGGIPPHPPGEPSPPWSPSPLGPIRERGRKNRGMHLRLGAGASL